jgi:NAD-dependent dihydropyrimidine dehydrogenase PreA subunit
LTDSARPACAKDDMSVNIDTLKCTGCEACVYVCPVGVLSVEDMKCRAGEGCISCGICVDHCDWQAITLEEKPKPRKAKKRNK